MKTFNENRVLKLKPYTVHYRNIQNIRTESCFYAKDAFDAKIIAMELNSYIHEHPNSIDLIRCENNNLDF